MPNLIANPNFDTNLNDWDDSDSGAGVSQWTSGALQLLTTNIGDVAARLQDYAVEPGKTYDLEVEITAQDAGPDLGILLLGTTPGASDILAQSNLGVGVHRFQFAAPVGTVYLVLGIEQTTATANDLTMDNTYSDVVQVERIKNGGFDTDLTDWDDKDSGGSSNWLSGGLLQLISPAGITLSAREQTVIVEPDALVSFSYDLTYWSGISGFSYFIFKVGSTSGADDIFTHQFTGSGGGGNKTGTFTPTISTIFVTLYHPNAHGLSGAQWRLDNISLLQPNPDGAEFPKKFVIL